MEMSISVGVFGLVLGLLFSFHDKKSGSKLYKKWYNVSNKNNIDPNLEIGFIYNQLFGQKLTVALIITAVSYVIGFLIFDMHPFTGLFYMIAYFLGLMIAFYTSTVIISLFSKKTSKVIDYIEKVEKEGIDLKEEAKKGFEKAKEKVMETVNPKEETKEIEKEMPKEEPKPDPKKDDNWRDGVKKFIDK